MEKASRLCKTKTGVACDGFHPKSILGFDNGNERRNRGVPGEGGTKWKVAAASLHSEVLLETEECHE